MINTLSSMVPKINHDIWVEIDTLPHLWNGGLALSFASVLLIMIAVKKKRLRKQTNAEAYRAD